MVNDCLCVLCKYLFMTRDGWPVGCHRWWWLCLNRIQAFWLAIIISGKVAVEEDGQ
jgi:hypothetical protein